MTAGLKQEFLDRWRIYFPGAELPIVFYYTDDEKCAQSIPPPDEWRCVICDLGRVRQGKALRLDIDSVACGGGKRYFGFSQELRPDFEYFLSCGIPGKMEGERYKKSPELVKQAMQHQQPLEAPGKFIVFKRWDLLDDDDDPLAVIFFAPSDVLAGLFTLANFDRSEPHGVIAPFGSGCSSIVHYPMQELQSEHPRAVLGMFDVSARPCVPAEVLTFTVPWPRFVDMAANMDESFLITESWTKIKTRLGRG